MPEKVSVDLTGARWVKLEMVDVYDGWRGWSVWGDAAFEMNPGKRPQDVSSLSRQLGALTPPAKKSPRRSTATATSGSGRVRWRTARSPSRS